MANILSLLSRYSLEAEKRGKKRRILLLGAIMAIHAVNAD
jgi:hypothetical protein